MSTIGRNVPLLVLLLLAMASAAQASPTDVCNQDPCTSRDRACVIEGAHTYLDALPDNGLSECVRLAPGAWRAGGGGYTDEAGIRSDLRIFECTNVAEIGNFRWYVDEEFQQGVLFYTVLADPTRGENCDPPTLPRESWIPAHVAERFRVLRGVIYEIELNLFISAPGTSCILPERREADFGPAGCGDTSRACVIETGRTFLDALLSHDGTNVPLAPDAWHVENCVLRGDGGEVIRAGLASPEHAQNVAVEHDRWFVDGEHAIVYFILWTQENGDASAPRSEWAPNYVTLRFRVDDGLIKEIEGIKFLPGDPGDEPNWPDDDGDGFMFHEDNCPNISNPAQEDWGGVGTSEPDGFGNACQCGDVTGNGIVNGQDAAAIKRYALQLESPTFLEPGTCDVSGNGTCNGQDANAIRSAALGNDSPLFGQRCPNFDPSTPCPDCP